ncbi:uncharacterized protein LOC134601582 [Pelobates fuscus]|uniref:uncharacterized protein LOC134601582 n=1 Tax=Pelobates fuscus TaxID=191477 RepID=UPI002FE479C0
MNMFDIQCPAFSIPVKSCVLNLFGEEMEPTKKGRADDESGLHKSKDTTPNKNKSCDQILDYIKQDLGLCHIEQSSDSEDGDPSRSSSLSGKSLPTSVNGKRMKKISDKKLRSNEEIGEEMEWKRAKQKIEQFLDFPAMISDLSLRNHPRRMDWDTQTGRPPAQSERVPHSSDSQHQTQCAFLKRLVEEITNVLFNVTASGDRHDLSSGTTA